MDPYYAKQIERCEKEFQRAEGADRDRWRAALEVLNHLGVCTKSHRPNLALRSLNEREIKELCTDPALMG